MSELFNYIKVGYILLQTLKVMTWHGTALGVMRYKCVAASGILSLQRKSLSSVRGPLLMLTRRRNFGFGGIYGPSTAVICDEEKAQLGVVERRWLHRDSRSVLSLRGGATSSGDKTKTKRGVSKDDRKRESSSSSSSTPSSTIASNESAKGNSRATTPIGSQTYQVSVGTEQGYRSYMEDEYFVSNDGDFAAVFDGHGGPSVSRYLRKNLYANVQAFLPLVVLEKQEESVHSDDDTDVAVGTSQERPRSEENKKERGDSSIESNNPFSPISSPRRQRSATVDDYANALASALDKVDGEILKISHWSFQGSTAIVIWFHEEQEEWIMGDESGTSARRRTILAANIGDSRAVLSRDNKAWDLSRDHKPDDPVERSRIEDLGGKVIWCGDTDEFGQPIEDTGVYRVNGNLALARAIGDRSERPHVTADPEIISVDVEEGDQFVIIATDGLWDVMESADAVNFVKLSLKERISKDKIAQVMVQEALRLGTWDNVTVVIIWIDPTL